MDTDTKTLQDELRKRLVEYAKIDTQSAYDVPGTPSTNKQKELGRLLVKQLSEMGLEVEIDEYGYVYAHLPSNRRKGSKEIPPLGFVAHLDTTPDAPGANVKPIIHQNYKGGDLNLKNGVIIPASDLEEYVGDTIITSDGTTLLGADDKAGIAEIVTSVGQIVHSGLKHGDIYLMFTTDEEIGRGTKKFNPEKFLVKSAYTFDGPSRNKIEDETFNASKATIIIKGYNCHAGEEGFQKLKNAITISQLYASNIPHTERPETTNGRHGFYHPESIKGDVNKVVMDYIIRDFDKIELERRKNFLIDLTKTYNKTYGPETVTIEIEDQYPNMKDGLNKHPEVLQIAFDAARNAGVDPEHGYVRGGTDGTILTIVHKIPCPNVFCGAGNPHSVREFASVNDMVASTNTLINIVKGHRDYHSQKTR